MFGFTNWGLWYRHCYESGCDPEKIRLVIEKVKNVAAANDIPTTHALAVVPAGQDGYRAVNLRFADFIKIVRYF